MQRNYESMLILRPDLDDAMREEVFTRITKRIEEVKGKVLRSKVWAQEKNFYYPIRGRGAEKKKYFKGCYWLLDFSLDTEKLPDLKETIRLEERIIRNMITKKDD